jgi:hypothetical protein
VWGVSQRVRPTLSRAMVDTEGRRDQVRLQSDPAQIRHTDAHPHPHPRHTTPPRHTACRTTPHSQLQRVLSYVVMSCGLTVKSHTHTHTDTHTQTRTHTHTDLDSAFLTQLYSFPRVGRIGGHNGTRIGAVPVSVHERHRRHRTFFFTPIEYLQCPPS